MGFSIDYIKELYDKAYKDGVKASETGNYALAKKKLYEAAVYAKKLAQLDSANSSLYEKRAERLKGLSESINVESLNTAVYGTQAAQSTTGRASTGKPRTILPSTKAKSAFTDREEIALRIAFMVASRMLVEFISSTEPSTIE